MNSVTIQTRPTQIVNSIFCIEKKGILKGTSVQK